MCVAVRSFASLIVAAGLTAAAVAAPPATKTDPEAGKPRPAATKPAEAKPTQPRQDPAKKPAEPAAKPETKPAPAAKPKPKPEAKPETKPAATKPAATKPAVRQPTRVDPADDAKQPVFATTTATAPKPLAPGGKYRVGDMQRPRPAVVSPATESNQQQPGRAPSDAVVLFDGTNFERWKRDGGPKKDAPAGDAPLWVIKNGYMECTPRSGGISTRDQFGDCQLHIEWATPSIVKGSSQGRGNSGVMLQGLGEVQVLDSYENDTYPDGQAAAIYGKYPPLVNASRRPGEWQTYDIVVELAKVDPATKQVTRPARLTVFHNGVLVHHGVELPEAKATKFGFGLQDHGNPVRYRNIWLRPLKGYDAQ